MISLEEIKKHLSPDCQIFDRGGAGQFVSYPKSKAPVGGRMFIGLDYYIWARETGFEVWVVKNDETWCFDTQSCVPTEWSSCSERFLGYSKQEQLVKCFDYIEKMIKFRKEHYNE